MEISNENAGGNSDHSNNEDPLLSEGRQGVGHYCSLCPHELTPASLGTKEELPPGPAFSHPWPLSPLHTPIPARDGSPVHAFISFPMVTVPTRSSCHPKRLLALHLFLAGQNSCALRQNQRSRTSMGDPHTEVGHS